MQYDALLFDLDGTLIDTETVALVTRMQAFAALGFPVRPRLYAGACGR